MSISRLARQLQHLLVADQGGGVLAVGEQHDGAPPQLARLLLLVQLLEGHVERVVQRGGARGLGARGWPPPAPAWSAVKSCRIVVRSLNWITCGVVLRAQRPHEADGGGLRAVGSFSSMEAEVSIIRASEIGMSSWLKIDSSWRTPSSKTAKSVFVQVGDVAAARVGHGHVEVDDLDRRCRTRAAAAPALAPARRRGRPASRPTSKPTPRSGGERRFRGRRERQRLGECRPEIERAIRSAGRRSAPWRPGAPPSPRPCGPCSEAGNRVVREPVLRGSSPAKRVEGLARAHGGEEHLAAAARRFAEVGEHVVVVDAAHLALAAAGRARPTPRSRRRGRWRRSAARCPPPARLL